jgi:hypothetical protein
VIHSVPVRSFILLAPFLFSLLFSCNEPDVIGIDLQPGSEQPGLRTDTLVVEAYTVQEDSLVVWSPLKNLIELPTLFLGSFNNDPYTGTSYAGFVTQVRLGNTITSSTFGGVTSPDSVVLSFLYRGLEGDSNAVHAISVYELTEKLIPDSTYYSSRILAKGNLLGHTQLIPNLKDSVVVDSVKLPPMMRIHLDNALGSKFMNDYIANPATFASNAAFADYFPGLILVDSTVGTGSILNLPTTSGYHRLTLYYGTDKQYEFVIDANAVRFSLFSHSPPPNALDNLQDDSIVVQSMAGLKDSLFIRNMNALFDDGPVAISSARLIFKVQDNTTGNNMSAHNNLLIFGSDSVGRNVTTADAIETGSYYGGTLNTTTNEYTFNIGRYMQQTLTRLANGGTPDYGLFLVAGGSTSNARRTVLKGKTSIRLVVTTTQLNP